MWFAEELVRYSIYWIDWTVSCCFFKLNERLSILCKSFETSSCSAIWLFSIMLFASTEATDPSCLIWSNTFWPLLKWKWVFRLVRKSFTFGGISYGMRAESVVLSAMLIAMFFRILELGPMISLWVVFLDSCSPKTKTSSYFGVSIGGNLPFFIPLVTIVIRARRFAFIVLILPERLFNYSFKLIYRGWLVSWSMSSFFVALMMSRLVWDA